MAWQGIEGHDAVVAQFVAAFARDRVAGSYLFIGPAGIGKSTFAKKLAKSLLCESLQDGLVPCGVCASCVQADAGSHPDIDTVEKPAERATIPLETFIGDPEHRMREGLCWRLLLRPALGGRKVAIILDADYLSAEAANCLLKTLEEPADRAVIILVGTALERQLPTIRSRCQIVRFRPLTADNGAIVRRILQGEAVLATQPIDAATLQACAEACDGSLHRARLLLDPALTAFRNRLFALLAVRPLHGVELARETSALVDAAGKDAPPRRARLKVVLEYAIEFFRTALRHDLTAALPADAATADAIKAWASGIDEPAEEAVEALQHTLNALESIDRNANLTILIDAWTAFLERPSFAQSS